MTILIDHFSLGANDLDRSRSFHDATLAALGMVGRTTVAGEVGYAADVIDPLRRRATDRLRRS